MRKLLSSLCVMVLLLIISVPVYASDAAPEFSIMVGQIIEETDGRITVQNSNDAEDIVVLNISSETVIVDSETGMSAGLDSRKNDLVKVFYGPVMTMSLPPISNAAIIAINIQEGGVFSPVYTVVEDITVEDNNAKITAENGSIIISTDSATVLMPYLTRNFVTVNNIKKGSELLVWYRNDIMLESFPAQANAERIVVIGPPSADETAAAPSDTAVPFDIESLQTLDGVTIFGVSIEQDAEGGYAINEITLEEAQQLEIPRLILFFILGK